MKGRALLLSVLLVVSILAGGVSFAGPAAAAPGGMTGVPDANIQDARADGGELSASELTVYTDAHAGTTSVSIVTESQADKVASGASLPDVANQKVCSNPGKAAQKNPNADCDRDTTPSLVLSDDVNHEGRTVAIDSAQLQDALGEIPGFVTVRNSETGERWQQPTRVEDGWVMIDAPHFSDNSVTWGGSVEIGQEFTNGSSVQYDVNNLDAASNVTINTTGVVNTKTETVSSPSATQGDSIALNPGGTQPLTNQTVSFTGNAESYAEAASGSGDGTITVGGDTDPTGPSTNDEPLVTFTATDTSTNVSVVDSQGDGSVDSEVGLVGDDDGNNPLKSEVTFTAQESGKIDQLNLKTESVGDDYGVTADVYVDEGEADGTFTQGTQVGTWDPEFYTFATNDTVTFDTPYELSQGQTYHVSFVSGSSDGNGGFDQVLIESDTSASSTKIIREDSSQSNYNEWGELYYSVDNPVKDPAIDIDGDGSNEATYTGSLYAGETVTAELAALTTGEQTVDTSVSSGSLPDWTVDYNRIEYTEDPGVDIDDDGADDASVSGVLSPGETITKDVPDLNRSTTEAVVSVGSEDVDVAISYDAHTQTVDPVVELNGETTQVHSGTLADGETVTTEISQQQLVEGTNKLNISMGDGSLSADAPAMKTQINYQHDAEDIQLVSYEGEKFTERYNVSKTYSSDRTDPTLTIPFDNTVAKIDAVEYRVNGGEWKSTDQHVLTGTEATIHLPDVTAGDTLTVRANGSRVAVSNGEISVTEPTNVGERLDTKFVVDSYDGRDDLSFALGDSLNAGQAHYVYNSTWTADEYNEIDSSGNHEFVMPNADVANTARISTVPVTATPSTNEVRLQIEDPQTAEPVFDVKPGASEGDQVEFTFLDATDGTEYVLYSQSRDIVVDAGTASSPLTLTGDDSDEILQFLVDDGGATSSGGGDGGVLGPIGNTQPSGTVIDVDLGGLAWLGILGVGSLGLFGLIYWRRGSDGATEAAQAAGGGAQSVLGYFASALTAGARWTATALTSTAGWLRRHPYISVTLLGAGVLGLFASGALNLPAGSGIVLVVTIAVVGSYIVLRRWADASNTVWAIGALATTVVGLEALGTSVIEPLLSSQGFVILIIVGAALAWRYFGVQQTEASTPDEVNKVNFETDGGDDEASNEGDRR
mgnify:CR=1 FL=1